MSERTGKFLVFARGVVSPEDHISVLTPEDSPRGATGDFVWRTLTAHLEANVVRLGVLHLVLFFYSLLWWEHGIWCLLLDISHLNSLCTPGSLDNPYGVLLSVMVPMPQQDSSTPMRGFLLPYNTPFCNTTPWRLRLGTAPHFPIPLPILWKST